VSPADEAKKALLKCCPDLRACEREDRLAPAIPDWGMNVLTTSGYVLVMSPFPVIAADPFGASRGPGFLTPSAMSGSAAFAWVLSIDPAHRGDRARVHAECRSRSEGAVLGGPVGPS
jgi:hypothetical protein